MAVQRLRLEIDAAPAYEFVLSLAAATAADGATGLAAEAREFAGGCDMVWTHLLTVAYDCVPPRHTAALLAAVEALHPRELRLRLLGYYVRYFRRATPPEVIAAAAAGDREAIQRFVATSYPDDPVWQGALRALLPLSAWQTRRRLLQLLRAWRDQFDAGHDPKALAAEAARRRVQARSLRAEQLVAAVMDGWDYVPEPGINAVLLIPSKAIWPLAHVFDHNSTKLICYPVRGGQTSGAVRPPAELLALGRAIADERRLRILRLLTTQQLTAQELAARLGVSLTTLLHHLTVLREVALVEAQPGRHKRYRLRRDRVLALASGLERFLSAEPTATTTGG